MKAKIVLASIGMILVCVLLAQWKPVPPAPASAPANVPVSSSAANKQEPPDSETVERTPFSVIPREVQPDLENVPAALLARISETLASTNSDAQEIVLNNLLPALVRADPLAAARFAETNQLGDTHDLILNRVAQLWGAQDAPSALNWASTLTSTNDRNATLTGVCLQIAESDPAEAVRTRSQYIADDQPNAGLEALAQRWAEKDFPSALDWALSRPDGTQRNELIARLAYVESQTSPVEAATLAVDKIPPGNAQTEAVMSVLHQWALSDFSAAKEWVGRFPEGDLRTRAVNELAGIAQYHPSPNPP